MAVVSSCYCDNDFNIYIFAMHSQDNLGNKVITLFMDEEIKHQKFVLFPKISQFEEPPASCQDFQS